MHADFNLFDAFKIFDQLARGSLTLPELNYGLSNNLGIVTNQDEIDLVFQRYDKDQDGRIRFAEFCDAFVPLDRNLAQVINSRQSNHR